MSTSVAERLARLCHLMAGRFARGGRLIALGETPAARSDARQLAGPDDIVVGFGPVADPLEREGAQTVAELGEATLAERAERLWIVPPGGSLLP